jgi:hypothetical protein
MNTLRTGALSLLIVGMQIAQADMQVYNMNDQDLLITYWVCNFSTSVCSDLQTFPLVAKQSVVTIPIDLFPNQQEEQLFVDHVDVLQNGNKLFTMTFPKNPGGLTNCYAYQASALKFDVYVGQDKVFCTPGAG